jgi:hypothetical protein
MAQAILCDNDDGNLAAIMISNTSNGDTFGFCPACVPLACDALAATFREQLAPKPAGDAPAPPDEPPEAPSPGAPFHVAEAEPGTEATPAGSDDTEPAPASDDEPQH